MNTLTDQLSLPPQRGQSKSPAQPKSEGLRPISMNFSLVALMCMLCGALFDVKTILVGELFFGELLLIPVAIGVVIFARGDRVLRLPQFFLVALAIMLMLCGYMVSDLYMHTEASQYIRGWGRIFLLLSDVVGLGILVGSDRRNLLWFCLGCALGEFVQLALITHEIAPTWKFGYSVPVTYLIMFAAVFVGPRTLMAMLLCAAVIGLLNEYRSYSAFATITMVLIGIRLRHPNRPIRLIEALPKLALAGVIGGIIVIGGLMVTAGKSNEYHRTVSDLGRSIGLQLGVEAVRRSPIIGRGSWNADAEISDMQEDMYLKALGPTQGRMYLGMAFTPHSQILQAWFEAGILVVPFFILYAWLLITATFRVVFTRSLDAMTAILLQFLLNGAWDFIMSPFGGNHRWTIALAFASVFIVLLEKGRSPKPQSFIRNNMMRQPA